MTHQLKKSLFSRFFWLFVIVLASNQLQASTETNKLRVINAVEKFSQALVLAEYPAASKTKVTVRVPDNRISFKHCDNPDLSLHGNQRIGSRILVKITCQHSIALHLAVDIAVFEQVVTSQVALARQTTLDETHIEMRDVNILTTKRAYVRQTSQAVGKRLKRSISAGTYITLGMLNEPTLIKRGDSVVIVAIRGPLVVKMPGTALANGYFGQQISVRNESSDRVVKGWVKGPGEIHVPM